MDYSYEYLMYLRKSRADLEAEARGEGETLKRHEKTLLDLAHKMGIHIPEENIFREIVSGETIASRPDIQKALSLVETGTIKGVFVMEVERLARGDTIDQGIVAQTFKYSNTKIITPMKIYDPSNEFDEEYFEFGLFMSRREYKTTNRRLHQGRKQSIAEGKYIHSVAPYGYKRVKLIDQKGFTLEIIDEEAKVVVMIFVWYTKGRINEDGVYERMGISIIVNTLNGMKIPARKGGEWTTSTVREILSNPVYTGMIKDGYRPQVKKVVDGEIVIERPRAKDMKLIKGLHPAIVKQEMYDLAQYYLSENPAMPVPARHVVKNPIAGLIECGVCGRKMNRKPYKNGYPDSLLCTGPTCTNVSSPLYLVEERLLGSLAIWLKEYKFEIKQQEIQGNDIETDVIEQSIKNIGFELDTLNKQLNNLYDLLEQGIYSKEIFIERSNILNQKIDIAKSNKRNLEHKLKSISIRKENKMNIIPKIEKVLSLYYSLETPKEKNDLLKEVIDKATYIKEEGGRWSGKVDSFDLKLYPKLIE